MFIDLTVTLDRRTPAYPGDPVIKIEPAGIFERDGWNDHYVSIGTHTGTHMDAPLHMIKDGSTLDQVPLEQFIGRGCLIDARQGFNLEVLRQAGIQADDILLFYTGMSKHYYEPKYFESYPVMPEEVAEYLIERKVRMVGVDAGSVDNADGFPIHKILLANNVLIVENLANLELLTNKDFTVYALPIKLALDGAPARVIAEVEG